MKKILLIFCLLFISYSHSQSDKKITTLNYTNIEIEVPEKCTAKSKYELLDCNGVSVQWIYFNKEMLKPVSKQLIQQYSKKTKSKEKVEVISFGSTLKGYKFTYQNPESWNRIVVYGTVNKQPLILNVASEDELVAISKLNGILKTIMKIKM